MRSIALLGYGIEGKSAYTFLAARYPSASFTVYASAAEPPADLPAGVSFKGNCTTFYDIPAELVVRTPSIAPARISSSGSVTSVTKLFFQECPAPIIGVTGSKGKGTTVSFIASILKAAGKTVHVVGNIGRAALDALPIIQPQDSVVYELSSYQLWDLDQSPQTAVVLAIEADHLDVHGTMADYVAAKGRIAIYQSRDDRIIFYSKNSYTKKIATTSPARKIPYPDTATFHYSNGFFFYGSQLICPTGAVQLPGQHNLENALAAIAAVWPQVHNGETIERGLSNFNGLPHRLAFVAEKKAVRYYDDSIATTPGATIAALAAFTEPKVIIIGGSSKGASYDILARAIAQQTIRAIMVVGSEAPRIIKALQAMAITKYHLLPQATMSEIVAQAALLARPGDVVLLSPACASLDAYVSYQDRGDQFIKAVKQLED